MRKPRHRVVREVSKVTQLVKGWSQDKSPESTLFKKNVLIY